MKRFTALAALLLSTGWFLVERGLADDEVPALLKQLKDSKKPQEERQKIAQAFIMTLKDLGPKASKDAIPALAECMKEKDQWTRIYAAVVLAGIGDEAVPVLVDALKDADVRPYASSYLQKLKAESAVKPLFKLLQTADKETAVEIAEVLGAIGKPAVPSLRNLLKFSTVQAKIVIVTKALAKMGPEAKEAIPELVQNLANKNAEVRSGIVEALGRIGPENPESTILRLADVLRLDPDQGVRTGAGIALARIGKAAVPTLVRLLKIPKVQVRADAADILRQIGPNAKEAVAGLTACLKDPEDAVRRGALNALEKIDPEPLLPTLVELMRDPNPAVRRGIPALLANLETKAKEAVEILAGALKDENQAVRYHTALALGAIGPPAEPALPALIKLLAQEEDAGFRADITTVLGKIGKASVPTLIEALKDPVSEVRLHVVAALESIGEEAKAAVPALTKISADDPNAEVRKAAKEALLAIQGKN